MSGLRGRRARWTFAGIVVGSAVRPPPPVVRSLLFRQWEVWLVCRVLALLRAWRIGGGTMVAGLGVVATCPDCCRVSVLGIAQGIKMFQ
jgi:hypothetical protein